MQHFSEMNFSLPKEIKRDDVDLWKYSLIIEKIIYCTHSIEEGYVGQSFFRGNKK